MPKLDLQRFAKIASRLAPTHAGDNEREQGAALMLANQLLAAVGLTWPDIVFLAGRAEIAEQAAKVAIAEANELRERVAELERQQPDWQTLAGPVGNRRQTIDWLLDQHRAGRVWLSPWELEHFPSIARWVGRLTDNQRNHLQKTLERIYQQTVCARRHDDNRQPKGKLDGRSFWDYALSRRLLGARFCLRGEDPRRTRRYGRGD